MLATDAEMQVWIYDEQVSEAVCKGDWHNVKSYLSF